MIFLLIFVLYAIGIGRYSVPLTGDQKVYISIANEMKERGSLIIPYLYGNPNFLKPPFQYWMTLLGWKICGFNLFGALLPSVLAVVLAAFLVKKIDSAQSNLPALIFASTLATMTYGSTAQMEIWIVVFYLASWFFYLEQKLFLCFLVVGVMSWIKGPLYPVLFVFSIVLKAYLDKDLKPLFRLRFICALTLGVVTALLWYFAAASTHYSELKDVFFGRENFGKLQTAQGSPLGLWSEFLATLFPISLVLVATFGDPGFREKFRNQKRFICAFALIPALFFTFFPYRVNAYLYLLTPVAAWMVAAKPNPRPSLKRAIQVVAVFVALIASIFAYRMWTGGWIHFIVFAGILAAFCAWAYAHFKLEGTWIAVASLIIVNLIRFGATEIGEWDLMPLRQTSASAIAYRIEPGQEDIWHEQGLISTALEKPIQRVRDSESESAFTRLGGLVILSDEQTPLADEKCDPWRRLKRRTKFPFREFMTSGLSIEDQSLHRVFQLCRSGK